jgi:hypothetical protein
LQRGRTVAGSRWQQADAGPTEQRQWIEVDATPQESPVQAAGDRAAGMSGRQRSDGVAGAHRLAGDDGRRHRLVRGSQAVRVIDAHDADPGDLTGETDHTGTGRVHPGRRCGGQVDPAVPG